MVKDEDQGQVGIRPEAVNRGHFRLGSFADHIDPERTLARYHTQEDEFWRSR